MDPQLLNHLVPLGFVCSATVGLASTLLACAGKKKVANKESTTASPTSKAKAPAASSQTPAASAGGSQKNVAKEQPAPPAKDNPKGSETKTNEKQETKKSSPEAGVKSKANQLKTAEGGEKPTSKGEKKGSKKEKSDEKDVPLSPGPLSTSRTQPSKTIKVEDDDDTVG
ncbi:hypothetical protein AAVH_07808 [Aphelenchoides avenae]|nr:hypothetical protein AAVH_07808 [Aphelenchus avenae]